MKWISSILIAALLVQTGYVPCAAQEPMVLKGDEIDRSKLKVGKYVEVTYYAKDGEGKTAKGYVKFVEDDALTVMYKGPTRIKYNDITTLVVGRSKRDIERLKKEMIEKAIQPGQEAPLLIPGIKVRITARSVADRRLVGTVVAARADTLVMKPKTGDLLTIPLISVSQFEVSRGRSSGSLGLLFGVIGFCAGAFVCLGTAAAASDPPSEDSGEGNVGALIVTLVGLTSIGGFAGAYTGVTIARKIRGEKWESVPLDHIRIGVSPQRHGGMILSASFGF